MDLTFGARLRLRREEQQISLGAIAEKTKINRSLLEGLERDDVSRWPRGIFRRSYFRSYVEAIGLDPDPLLRQFLELHPDTEEEVTTLLARARDLEAATRRPPSRLRCLFDSAVSALPTLHVQPSQLSHAGRPEAPKRQETPDRPPIVQPEREQRAEAHDVVEAQIEPLQAVSAPDVAFVQGPSDVDFSAVGDLCTRLCRAGDLRDVTPVLEDAARLLNGVGLTLWIGEPLGRYLTPVFAHGYPAEMVERLPVVTRESENAIALAFRTADTRVVDGGDPFTGAVVVPLLAPAGCSGVLALELRHGDERRDCVRAAMTILAAQLSTLFEVPVLAEAVGA